MTKKWRAKLCIASLSRNLVPRVLSPLSRSGERTLGTRLSFASFFRHSAVLSLQAVLGPVVQKPINANPRSIAYEGVYISTPKCCSTLIFGKNLH